MMKVPDAQAHQKITENIEKIEKIVREDRRVSIKLITEMVPIDKERIQQILHDNLYVTKVCAKVVPMFLTHD